MHVVTVGQTGAWIGPAIVAGLAGLLDYSAVGYYAAGVSFVALFGLDGWERSTFTSYDERMTWAVASLVTHGGLLVALFGERVGPTRLLAAQLSKRMGIGVKASDSNRINSTLVNWVTAAAVTAPMSGNAGWGRVVDAIDTMTTGAAATVAGAVLRWIGG